MATAESRAHYRLRKHTVEPAFGIVKEAMGFWQFLLRGLEKVEAEWALVTLAYNCKRLNGTVKLTDFLEDPLIGMPPKSLICRVGSN